MGPRLELVEALALGSNFEAQFAAGVRLAVERLSDRGWAADVAYGEDFNVEIAGIVGDVQLVAGMNLARRFDALPRRVDPPEFAGLSAKLARLVEARRPQPLVNTNPGHGDILPRKRVFNRALGLRTAEPGRYKSSPSPARHPDPTVTRGTNQNAVDSLSNLLIVQKVG